MKASVRGFLGEVWDITLKLNWGSMKSSLQIASECVAFPRKLKSEVNTIHKTEILPQRSAAETSEVASSWDHTWDFHMMITLDMGLCICSCFSQSHFYASFILAGCRRFAELNLSPATSWKSFLLSPDQNGSSSCETWNREGASLVHTGVSHNFPVLLSLVLIAGSAVKHMWRAGTGIGMSEMHMQQHLGGSRGR